MKNNNDTVIATHKMDWIDGEGDRYYEVMEARQELLQSERDELYAEMKEEYKRIDREVFCIVAIFLILISIFASIVFQI